jgi:hypothetical protein
MYMSVLYSDLLLRRGSHIVIETSDRFANDDNDDDHENLLHCETIRMTEEEAV